MSGQAAVRADDLLLAQVIRPQLASVRYRLPSVDLIADSVDSLVTGRSADPLPRVWFELVARQST